VVKPAHADTYKATIHIAGSSFGSGAVKLQSSPDGGTTKVDLKDTSGAAYSTTANDVVNIELGDGGTNSDMIKLYAVMTDSTAPDVTVTVHDNL
jgi:hypothetical protein